MLPPVGPVYAGSFLVLNCIIQLSSAVDSEVVVTTMWRKNGMVLEDSTQSMISDNNSSILYRDQLVFSPLQLNTDNGLYICEVAVHPTMVFILSSGSSSNNVSVFAIGMPS